MPIEIEDIAERGRWDRLVRRVGYAPWQQSWSYGAALTRTGRPVHRLRLVRDGRDVGIAQVTERLLAGRGCRHVLGGPLWLPGIDAADRAAALRTLRAALSGPLRCLLVTPALPHERCATALRRAGMHRVMSGYATALLPLDRSAEAQARRLRPSWRRRVAKPAPTDLTITVREAASDLLTLDAALARAEEDRRSRGYAALPVGVVAAAARSGPAMLATATGSAGLEAFTLVFVHGGTATYQVGWTSSLGRRLEAHHRLLWDTLPHLRARRVRLLDMGGLNVPHGIAAFKLAAGAVPRVFAGTFL